MRSFVPALTVVLDTNLLVSAFLTPGGEAWEILRRVRNHHLVLSPAILAELGEVLLTRPRIRKAYAYPDEEVHRYCQELLAIATVVPVTTLLTVCRDPDDNEILACAVDGQAEYLITRNIDHFPETHGKVSVISPQEALRIFLPT